MPHSVMPISIRRVGQRHAEQRHSGPDPELIQHLFSIYTDPIVVSYHYQNQPHNPQRESRNASSSKIHKLGNPLLGVKIISLSCFYYLNIDCHNITKTN